MKRTCNEGTTTLNIPVLKQNINCNNGCQWYTRNMSWSRLNTCHMIDAQEVSQYTFDFGFGFKHHPYSDFQSSSCKKTPGDPSNISLTGKYLGWTTDLPYVSWKASLHVRIWPWEFYIFGTCVLILLCNVNDNSNSQIICQKRQWRSIT